MAHDWRAGWLEDWSTTIEGVEVRYEDCVMGSGVFDLYHPCIYYSADKQWEEAPRNYRLIVPMHPSKPNERKVRRGIQEYIERFGKPPDLVSVCDSRSGTYGIVLWGDKRTEDYEWPPCEWCGSTGPHNKLCLPTEVTERGGEKVYRVSLTEPERDVLFTLAAHEHDIEISKVLMKKLGG